MSQRNLLHPYSGNPEDEGSWFLQNTDEYLSEYTISYNRRQ
jgi:hypothetical protein